MPGEIFEDSDTDKMFYLLAVT